MSYLFKKALGWLILISILTFVWYGLIHWQNNFLEFLKINWDGLTYIIGAILTLIIVTKLKRSLGLISAQRIKLEHDWNFLTQALRLVVAPVERSKELLTGFVELIKEEAQVEWVRLYLFREGRARCVVSASGNWCDDRVSIDSDLSKVLHRKKGFFTVNEKISSDLATYGFKAQEQLKELGAECALGMIFQNRLVGIVFLGKQLKKRTDKVFEQQKLEILVGQLTLALEAFQLSTELKQNNVYHMKLLEAFLEQSGSGVLVVDPKGFILISNQEARRLLQWKDVEAIPSSMKGLPEEVSEILQLVLTQGETIEGGKMPVRLKEDSELFLIYSCRRFEDNEGKILGAQFIFHDISQIKHLEKQLHHANRLANLGTLSASMVHEIKNPLVAIKTFVQLLPERMNDADFLKNFSHLIGHEVGRIDQIVSQLLTLARPPSSNFSAFHLHEVIEAMLALYQPDLVHRKIKVKQELEAEADLIQGDRQQIQQILMNLVVNAEEAMRNGGTLGIRTVVVMRSTPEKEFELEEKIFSSKRPYIRLTIQDSGHGMMPKVLKRVFEPFYSTKPDGNGLGLSIVMGIIKDHQGTIEVESELSQGTKFHLYFPLVSKESYA